MIQWAAMGTGVTTAHVAAIVLAAGGSARMGKPKQLLLVRERPMVRLVTEEVAAAGLAQVVVVTGAHAEMVSKTLEGLAVDVVFNEDWASGLSSSIRTGLRALHPHVQAALLVLGDQPGLRADLIRLLVARYGESGAPIVAPFFGGRRGNPVLFDRTLFSELLTVEGDRGGRLLIARHDGQVERVDVEDPSVVTDIDSPQDYQRWLGELG